MSQHRQRLCEPLRYTLTELEEQDWGPPTFDSWLVRSVHQLRNVPLKDLTAGDVRLLIGQKVGLPYLVPLAINVLTADPFIDGSLYAGDLLQGVIQIPRDFWHTHESLASEVALVARQALDSADIAEVGTALKTELQLFIETQTA